MSLRDAGPTCEANAAMLLGLQRPPLRSVIEQVPTTDWGVAQDHLRGRCDDPAGRLSSTRPGSGGAAAS